MADFPRSPCPVACQPRTPLILCYGLKWIKATRSAARATCARVFATPWSTWVSPLIRCTLFAISSCRCVWGRLAFAGSSYGTRCGRGGQCDVADSPDLYLSAWPVFGHVGHLSGPVGPSPALKNAWQVTVHNPQVVSLNSSTSLGSGEREQSRVFTIDQAGDPTSSLLTCHWSSVGRRATSSWALETSMPTNTCGSLITTPPLRPAL